MAVTIREMRLDDVEAVVSAVGKAGATVDRAAVLHNLSLLAMAEGGGEAGGVMPGAVLCVRSEGGGVALEVIFDAEPALVRQLIDKALVKLHAAGIRTCRIRIHGTLPSESDPLSTDNNWFARFARHRAA
ncbi:MAG: hypothetical protein WD534_16885 [Phycisphaeraceae bacterium]